MVTGRAKIATALLLVVPTAGCMEPLPITAFESGAPAMRAETFFLGKTRGSGVLQNRVGRPSRAFQVASTGRAVPGGIRVDQEISWSDGEVDRRSWTVRRIDRHRYRGELSDAPGPVTAEARGNVLRLRYKLRDPGVYMEQWLYLQPDGRNVLNEGTITVMGMVVARLSEQIVRAD